MVIQEKSLKEPRTKNKPTTPEAKYRVAKKNGKRKLKKNNRGT